MMPWHIADYSRLPGSEMKLKVRILPLTRFLGWTIKEVDHAMYRSDDQPWGFERFMSLVETPAIGYCTQSVTDCVFADCVWNNQISWRFHVWMDSRSKEMQVKGRCSSAADIPQFLCLYLLMELVKPDPRRWCQSSVADL